MAANIPSVVIDKARHVLLPVLGYGTGTAWFKGNPDAPFNAHLVASIKKVLALGYTHIDGAEMYNTEVEIGAAIKESGIPREKLFVTTKVFGNLNRIEAALDDSLRKLQLDYVDLYLIHAPFFDESSRGISRVDAWKAMDRLYKSGKAKSVGVSNYRTRDLEEIYAIPDVVRPAVNQIELHPYNQAEGIVATCKRLGITLEAYGPLCPIVHAPKDGPLDPVLHAIAEKHNTTADVVLLRWSIQKGYVPVSTSSKEERLNHYLQVFSVSLSDEEIRNIDEAGRQKPFRKFWADKDWAE